MSEEAKVLYELFKVKLTWEQIRDMNLGNVASLESLAELVKPK